MEKVGHCRAGARPAVPRKDRRKHALPNGSFAAFTHTAVRVQEIETPVAAGRAIRTRQTDSEDQLPPAGLASPAGRAETAGRPIPRPAAHQRVAAAVGRGFPLGHFEPTGAQHDPPHDGPIRAHDAVDGRRSGGRVSVAAAGPKIEGFVKWLHGCYISTAARKHKKPQTLTDSRFQESHRSDSNRRPTLYESVALPAELRRHSVAPRKDCRLTCRVHLWLDADDSKKRPLGKD